MVQTNISKTEQAVKEDDPLKARITDYLMQKGISATKPIQCLSPEHADQKPSMSYFPKGHTMHCFSCGANLDIYDLVAMQELNAQWDSTKNKPVYDFNEAKKATMHALGLPENSKDWQPVKHPISELSDETKALMQKANETYLKSAQKRLEDPEAMAYLRSRGISLETAKKYGLGYLPDWKSVTSFYKNNGQTGQPSKRLIVPTGLGSSYLARSIDDQGNYSKMREGQPFFNLNALSLNSLKQDKAIFIVEGEFDALSIIEAGHTALALSSVANADKFVTYVQGHLTHFGNLFRPKLFILMDNDQTGQQAQKKLFDALRKLPLEVYKCSMLKGFKDANEALVSNKKLLINELNKVVKETENDNLKSLINFIGKTEQRKSIKTGFDNLDKMLDGGLNEGLYTLGAVSSLGKTALFLQIADNLAKAGHNVMYFALEMSKYELMARSVSRETYQASQIKYGDDQIANHILQTKTLNASKIADYAQSLPIKDHSRTAIDIIKGNFAKKYNKEQQAIIQQAMASYGRYASKIYFQDDSNMRPTSKSIVEKVDDFIKKHPLDKEKPVIIVDYLQMIKMDDSPENKNQTDKSKVTDDVENLKHLARQYHVPVILISSLNREGYKQVTNGGLYHLSVSMANFKESGEIEYTSDVLLSIEPLISTMNNEALTKFKKGILSDPTREIGKREVIVKVLKNRNGQTGVSAGFNYYPAFHTFEPHRFSQEEINQISEAVYNKTEK